MEDKPIITPVIVKALEDLFSQISPADLRKTLVEIYFEVTTVPKDMSIDFPIHVIRYQELIRFLDKVEEEQNQGQN